MQCLLLDHNFIPISFVSFKKAIKLIVKERAEIIQSTNKEIYKGIFLPKVLRLLRSIDTYFKRTIKWTKGNVFLRDNYICSYCGVKIPKGKCTLDHIIPVSKGGKNKWENSATCCLSCNQAKGDKYLHEVGFKLRKEPRTPTLLDLIAIKFKDFDMNEVWANR